MYRKTNNISSSSMQWHADARNEMFSASMLSLQVPTVIVANSHALSSCPPLILVIINVPRQRLLRPNQMHYLPTTTRPFWTKIVTDAKFSMRHFHITYYRRRPYCCRHRPGPVVPNIFCPISPSTNADSPVIIDIISNNMWRLRPLFVHHFDCCCCCRRFWKFDNLLLALNDRNDSLGIHDDHQELDSVAVVVAAVADEEYWRCWYVVVVVVAVVCSSIWRTLLLTSLSLLL